MSSRRRKTLAERLWSHVDRSAGPDGCWPFTGTVTKQGYGRIRSGVAGEPTIGAHRAAFIVTFPDPPAPELVDHTCHDPDMCDLGTDCPHRRCCNPAHVAPSTPGANSASDRQWTRRRLTACIHGHRFTKANTYWWTDRDGQTQRKCRRCGAARARRYRRAAAC